MKRFLIATTALAVAFTGTMASAQRWEGRGGQQQRDGRWDGRDNDRRGDSRWNDRNDRRDGYRNGRGDRRYEGNRRYSRGDRYRGDGVYFRDYRRYGYRAPPRGYGYYRTNDGDILLAAIATGIISSVIIGRDHRR